MPETPDFDAIAQRLSEDWAAPDAYEPMAVAVVAQLRLVWNARGAADIAEVKLLDEAPADMTTAAIRSLDR